VKLLSCAEGGSEERSFGVKGPEGGGVGSKGPGESGVHGREGVYSGKKKTTHGTG